MTDKPKPPEATLPPVYLKPFVQNFLATPFPVGVAAVKYVVPR